METTIAYIPADRRYSLAQNIFLPERTQGTALFADISGFTPLTEALARALGPQRGAEELTFHLNRVYDALIAELDNYSGSVISFSGDAITCWFEGDSGLRTTACALAMQQAMQQFNQVIIPGGQPISLAMKAAVATGTARRYLVGDPKTQVIDVLAGQLLDKLAATEHQANKGEVLLDQSAADSLGNQVQIKSWRTGEENERYAVVENLQGEVPHQPWPPFEAALLGEEQVRPWLLPPVYQRLNSGQGEFLAELRPAVALFLRFSGIDYDHDEHAGQKLDQYIRQVQQVLARYEGNLIQLTIGDKGSYLYAAFGAPLAHEDDAQRAISSALEMQALGGQLDYIGAVQIGITLGRMRTGSYGGITRRTYGVLGDNVNLAARLMQAASPGQILANKAVQQATPEIFIWENLPPIRVKGKSEPITVFGLLGKSEYQPAHLRMPQYTLPMVGRQAELRAIEEKMALALAGKGQIIGIKAEAGMGKSRLVAEVIRLAERQQVPTYTGECQAYGINTAYLVWQPIWRDFFNIDPSLTVEQQEQSLNRQLAQIDANLVQRMPLLGKVLNLPIPDNDLTSTFDAKLRKMSLEALLVDCLRVRTGEIAEAGSSVSLFVLEDTHWLDPLSHDLLEAVGRAIANLPVLVVMAYRPPDLKRLQERRINQLGHFSEIVLNDFTPQESERLIRLKLEQFHDKGAEISPDLAQKITQRAQGNPFYIEELLNYLQDQRTQAQDRKTLARLDLPTSLQSLILSRIDQLSERQKTMLKVASVIGRVFKAAMVWGVYPQLGDYSKVLEDLENLQRLDLTPLERPEPDLTYIFKHIITQEVAYESLLYAMRASLHDRVGRYIELTYTGNLTQYLDLLAFHYDRSPNQAKRREYLLKAGEAAQASYANDAAIDYYQRVADLLPEKEQIKVILNLGEVLELTGKWEQASDQYHQALDLARRISDLQAQGHSQTAMGELLRKQGQYTEAESWQKRARVKFERAGDRAGVAQTLQYAGTLAAQQGELDAARQRYQQSLNIQRELGDKARIASLLSNLGILACYQSDFETGQKLYEESLALRREVGDRRAIANSLNNLGYLAIDQGNYDQARLWLDEALALQREVGDRWSIANSLNNLGNVHRAQQDYTGAQTLYRESLEINQELGDLWAIAYLLEDIGGLAALQSQPERSLQLAGAADKLRQDIGAPLSPAEQEKLSGILATARQSLSQPAQEALWAEGQQMDLEQAIAYATREDKT